jgi:hypothetical protein
MTTETCNTPNPLIRDGVSQDQRRLAQLHPRHARIDDRTLADFLNFARAYARELQYYDDANQVDGDWVDFFDHDVASIIAEVARHETVVYRKLFNDANAFLDGEPDAASIEASGLFEALFKLIFSLMHDFNRWLIHATVPSAFGDHLRRLVTSRLVDVFDQTVKFYNHARTRAWFGASTNPPLSFDIDGVLFDKVLSALWSEGRAPAMGLRQYIASHGKDDTVFGSPGADAGSGYREAARTLLNWVDEFLQAETQLIDAAPGYLFEVIHHWPGHKPHMALYIAFIRLFSYLQAHLNNLTGRHLDFYYRDILGFEHRPAESDRVHVLFELAKQADKHLLPAGVLLKAGFDDLGKPVDYVLTRELALNRARIAAPGDIRSISIDRENGQQYRVYCAPVANSANGCGAEFEDAAVQWPAFAPSFFHQGQLLGEGSRRSKTADIGLSISSPLLDLREGARSIEITLALDAAPAKALVDGQIRARLSAPGAWIEAPVFIDPCSDQPCLKLRVELDNTQPAVCAFDSTQLTDRVGYPAQPVLELLLVNDPQSPRPYAYAALKELGLNAVTIKVTVKGVSQLIVQNDLGRLDVNKPFQPFGPQPVMGSRFYIGCDEAFRKPVSSVDIHYQWQDAPTDFSTYYQVYNDEQDTTDFAAKAFQIDIHARNDFAWGDGLLTGKTLFDAHDCSGEGLCIRMQQPKMFADAPDLPHLGAYARDTRQGFLRWQLSAPLDGFGHRLFPSIYAKRVVMLTTETATALPNAPYTPVISSITLDYAAEIEISFTESGSQSTHAVYHVYPFGTLPLRHSDAPTRLMPIFATQDADARLRDNQGELYIGLSDVRPPQNVTLFFQIAEGSADPELDKETIHWSCLTVSGWRRLDDRQVSYDSSNGFNRSGIVSITLPGDVDQQSTLLPAGRVWLRASVYANTAAVSHLVQVATQAGEASFSNHANDDDFLAQPLAAGSISKLKVKQGAIKSIAQPFASRNGRAAESQGAFNTRVSERLRHKDRGISIWDVEHLVLQQFPEVYKAKCINHSTYGFARAADDFFSSEFAPGYVSVIVIPRLDNEYALNPLQPRLSLDRLDEIKQFLQTRMTPFAARKLRVINPLYETIQLTMSVALHAGYDPAIYRDILNQDLQRYLSPWAFDQQHAAQISFGGRLFRSVLLNFVEERPYINYLTAFSMTQSAQPGDDATHINVLNDVQEALPHSSRSIFVSHAQHLIDTEASC